ncbi:hypothetical protein ACJIZ3_011147 [Penstemon smallii]|uniref:Uncharacterized protein n=1 Tax=Penstemon smallii TaxID=265156 RepID=A0ABD3ULV8_9LAMI
MVLKSLISAPPGFSAPPPGFTSHQRTGKKLDTLSEPKIQKALIATIQIPNGMNGFKSFPFPL